MADLIVVPVRPTAFDLAAAQGVVAIINAGEAYAVLFSPPALFAPPRLPRREVF